MLSKVLSFLLYYPQVVFPVCGGAIAYLSVYKKRPLKTRFLILPILVVITFLLSLIDNPFSDRTYSGLLFVFYNVYVFTPLSVACSITSLLKSIYHYKLFRMPLALVLVINGSINDRSNNFKPYFILWGTFYFIDTILCIFHFNCDKHSGSICDW